MTALNPAVQRWVDEIQKMTTPDKVVVCDGSEAERDRLIKECLASGELIELNQKKLPGCYLHRSAPHDVARTEHLTFVCTRHKDEAAPHNKSGTPADANTPHLALYPGATSGRTV